MKNFSPLEEAVIKNFLEGESDTLHILRKQLGVATVAQREMTGVGFFLHFEIPLEAPRLPENPDLIVSKKIEAQIDGLANGAGFVLWVTKGALDQLEGFCYAESWPDHISGFKLKADSSTSISLRKVKG